jgi:plasmid stabilization system protein ParE
MNKFFRKPNKNMGSDMEIIWSLKAKTTFNLVLDYLDRNWTRKEVESFYYRTQIVLKSISKYPELFPASTKNRKIRKAIVDKNNTFYYKIDTYHQRIHVLTFFDSRQDPQILKL